MKLTPVQDIDFFWPRVRHLLEPAVGVSHYDTLQDIYMAVLDERAILWIIHEGTTIYVAIVTQIRASKKLGKIFTVWALGAQGNKIRKWIHFIKELEAFAEREGCKFAIHDLRPEWVSIMCKRFGYRMTHATIERELKQ